MTDRLIQLARPEIAGMTPYVGGRPIEEVQRELGIDSLIKLASNENPRGPSPAVLEAMANAAKDINRYPDGNGFYLKNLLAEAHGVEPDVITLGNGSNDILELIATSYLQPGCNAVYSQYAFIVYPMVTQKSGAESKVIAADNFAHDLKALTAACDEHTRVLFLANPNNPTGSCFSEEQLLQCLHSVSERTLVVLDEAYYDYAKDLFPSGNSGYPQSISLLAEFPNLIVTRSFSKVYGLGGLRVGYSLSHPAVADVLNRARQPFNVSSIALAGAVAAVEDKAFVRDSVALNRTELKEMKAQLAELGIACMDSYANFLTFSCKSLPISAADLEAKMLRAGVILRGLQPYGMPDHLRVSLGLASENQRFLAALREVLIDAST